MGLQSKNMNYVFNVEYFKGINLSEAEDKNSEAEIKKRNNDIVSFRFSDVAPLEACKDIPGYREFGLYTLYPGLLIGIGNPHEIAMKEALKLGFSFDYVTGLPYIPGSSLKGMLRAYFPGETKDAEKDREYEEMLKALLADIVKNAEIDVKKLKDNMFENNDIFLGAFPVATESGFDGEKGKLLELEYITPHKKFKNPNPISLLKVRPAVKFVFAGVFTDYKENGEVLVSSEQKMLLCKELLMLFGIGAKTNTGYGRFSEKKPMKNNLVSKRPSAPRNENNVSKKPSASKGSSCCQKCGRKVGIDMKTGQPFRYCRECHQKQ